MVKIKLFPLISIFTLIILFGTAATCNLCGITPTTETESSETVENDTGNTSDQTEQVKETVEQTTEQETTDTTESKTKDSLKEVPTIKLKIYEGPTFSSSDNVCYYRIEAAITGSPIPIVKFSKDDSNSTLGPTKSQVNLTQSNPSYTLTATAKNSEGIASDSIELDWGCAPLAEEKTVEFVASDSGAIGPSGFVMNDTMFIGDSEFNTDIRGRFAFDVSSLAEKEIIKATLKLLGGAEIYNCDFKGPIVVYYNDFLPGLTSSDYFGVAYAGPEIFPWDTYLIEFSNEFLKNKVKERADSGVKIQFGIGYQDTNTGGLSNVYEGLVYIKERITLTVSYLE